MNWSFAKRRAETQQVARCQAVARDPLCIIREHDGQLSDSLSVPYCMTWLEGWNTQAAFVAEIHIDENCNAARLPSYSGIDAR